MDDNVSHLCFHGKLTLTYRQFGSIGGIDFEMGGPDVLDNFDFDSFLTTDGGADGFNFDPSGMNFGTDGGLEAGGDL